MATRQKDIDIRDRRSAVDASKEIVIDALYMTTDVLHSIRNNLPVELSAAQLVEQHRGEDSAGGTTVGARKVVLGSILLVIVMFVLAFALRSATSATNGQAVDEARFSVANAIAADVAHDPVRQLEIAAEMVENGDVERGSRIMGEHWKRGFRTAGFAADYASALLETGRYRQARRVTAGGLALQRGDEALQGLFLRSIEEDPAFSDTPVELDTDLDALSLHDADDMTFRATRDGEAQFIFRPDRVGDSDAWKREVAAFRVCEAVLCAHGVPSTRVVKVSRDRLEALYDSVSTPKQLAMRDRLETLNWKGDDGEEFVVGALSEWVGDSAAWPVEKTTLWRNWLSVQVDEDVLDESLAKAHEPAKELDGSYHRRIMNRAEGAATRQVAEQLASMITFDFLTNNWSRFERDEANWGANVRFADGQLFSAEHQTAFRERSSKRVRGRFHWTTRLDAEMAAAIRHLDRDRLAPTLFGGNGRISKRAERVFWRQTKRFDRRVERLEKRHGTENVLYF